MLSSSPDALDLRRPADAGVKEGYPSKKWNLSAVGFSIVKTVADSVELYFMVKLFD